MGCKSEAFPLFRSQDGIHRVASMLVFRVPSQRNRGTSMQGHAGKKLFLGPGDTSCAAPNTDCQITWYRACLFRQEAITNVTWLGLVPRMQNGDLHYPLEPRTNRCNCHSWAADQMSLKRSIVKPASAQTGPNGSTAGSKFRTRECSHNKICNNIRWINAEGVQIAVSKLQQVYFLACQRRWLA